MINEQFKRTYPVRGDVVDSVTGYFQLDNVGQAIELRETNETRKIVRLFTVRTW